MLRRTKKLLAGVVALAALAVGGAAIADAASSNGSSTSTSASTTTAPAQTPPAAMSAHGSAAHEDAEKPVTGTAAAKAQAAAVKIVGSGTAGAVTTDFQGSGYEVTVTKSDGSTVEIHLDSSLDELQPHGGFRPGGPPPASATG